MREVIARIVDAREFLEFGADYGAATVCGHAAMYGMPIGIITNNGPIDPAGANKATHFIQSCCQADIPLLYLQNTTGYIVGKASEQAGMIKHGSKMIQAVTNATVPSITMMCGASFGAGNYGMCGRAFGPRFVFSWPNARTAVMGGEQAALTMRIVAEGGAKRKGVPVDEANCRRWRRRSSTTSTASPTRFYTSGRTARRRRHRPARHAPRARPVLRHLPRGRCAHPAADAVRRRPTLRNPMQHTLYTEDHIALQDSLKKFCDAEINPHIDEWEKAEIFPGARSCSARWASSASWA